jgi:predicted DNA-binding transcriptional regulator AlpA
LEYEKAMESMSIDATPLQRGKRHRRLLKPALLRAAGAAGYTGVSEATWWRWDSAGLCPGGVKIAGCRLWSRRELDGWIGRGCPPRDEWEVLKRQKSAAR